MQEYLSVKSSVLIWALVIGWVLTSAYFVVWVFVGPVTDPVDREYAGSYCRIVTCDVGGETMHLYIRADGEINALAYDGNSNCAIARTECEQ